MHQNLTELNIHKFKQPGHLAAARLQQRWGKTYAGIKLCGLITNFFATPLSNSA
jgi:3,4-dihydroxy-2-butanone 4-phosphate synthase